MAVTTKTSALRNWNLWIGILVGCTVLFEKGRDLVLYLLSKGILSAQNGKLMIVPLLQHHALFKWVGVAVGATWFLVNGWFVYKTYIRRDFNEYQCLYALFLLTTPLFWVLTLATLSEPQPIPWFIFAFIALNAVSLLFTCVTLRAVWLTVTDSLERLAL